MYKNFIKNKDGSCNIEYYSVEEVKDIFDNKLNENLNKPTNNS